MTPQEKRLMYPKRAPRALKLCWWPWHMAAALIGVYHKVYFSVLTPKGRGES